MVVQHVVQTCSVQADSHLDFSTTCNMYDECAWVHRQMLQMCLMRDEDFNIWTGNNVWHLCVSMCVCVVDSGSEEVCSFHTDKALFHTAADLWPPTLKKGGTVWQKRTPERKKKKVNRATEEVLRQEMDHMLSLYKLVYCTHFKCTLAWALGDVNKWCKLHHNEQNQSLI